MAAAAVDRIRGLGPGGCWRLGGFGAVACAVGPGVCRVLGYGLFRADDPDLQAAVAGQSWGDRVRLRVQPADVAEGCRRAISMWWCSTRWSSTSRARGICLMCWQWRCDCWHRAGRCLSATCATCRCCGVHHRDVVRRRPGGEGTAAAVREQVRRGKLAEQELLLARSSLRLCPSTSPISPRWRCSSSGWVRSTNSAVTATRWCCVRRRCRCGLLPTCVEPWQRFGSLARLGEYLRSQQHRSACHRGALCRDMARCGAGGGAGSGRDRVPVSELGAGISAPDAVLPHECHPVGRNWDTPRR